MRKKLPEDITTTVINLETWNDCPKCGKAWKDKIPTPGLLHRTRLCDRCSSRKADDEYFRSGTRYPGQ